MNKKIFSLTKLIYNHYGLRNLKKNQDLFETITSYLKLSDSTGCSYYDYWVLYNYVRKNRPKEILECGTGVSTIVMAYALMENIQDSYPTGRITSMEDVEHWYQHASKLIPRQLNPYIDLIYSPKVEFSLSIFHGVGYRDLPARAYEFVFIDGPEATAPSDGNMSFDFDFINVVKNTDQPVFAIVDKRVSTCFVFQKIFGLDKVRFNPKCDLGFVGPITRSDLNSKIGTGSFSHSFRVLGNSKLNFYMKPMPIQ